MSSGQKGKLPATSGGNPPETRFTPDYNASIGRVAPACPWAPMLHSLKTPPPRITSPFGWHNPPSAQRSPPSQGSAPQGLTHTKA